MIEIAMYQTEEEYVEAVLADFCQRRPEPTKPEEPTMERPKVIALKSNARLWLEIVISTSYDRTRASLCYTGSSGSTEISLDELKALRTEVHRAISDLEIALAYTDQETEFNKLHSAWRNERYDVQRAAERAWIKAHPEPDDDYDEDEE